MAHVQVHRDDISLDSPTLIEGLPGVGLVGKIAADHLVDVYDMEYYASAHCEGLPEIAVYGTDDPEIRPPVRLYADEDRDLLVLQSDAPISPSGAKDFAGCMVRWFEANDAMPIYLSGRPAERDGVPNVYGVSTGDGAAMLKDADVAPPSENGAMTGPTGALVHESQRVGLTGIGLIVEADQQFPDPEAARALLQAGIGPLIGSEVDTDALVEQAEEIGQAKAQLAQQLQENQEESTSARPLGMYQ
ncbi:PAC2 family protein [Haloarcula sp. 1CSR25-25]|uniref:proteasome assembly chaperone family protein n=1 Tax=Haloarcula sp. 1CSR25-25 TaxID=2862545 RepID=UPI002895994E|nr:PAC2 family protein [Haloarcula sp. 1CSR25-25]MDT3435111.1 PAC2 family protein [Haloarcula sp. 1CSR25-25]